MARPCSSAATDIGKTRALAYSGADAGDGRADKTDVRSVSSNWVTKAALLKRWGEDARKSTLLAKAVRQYELRSTQRVGAATTPRKRTPARPEEWEECEDEHGNVFYYNLKTGATRMPEEEESAYV